MFKVGQIGYFVFRGNWANGIYNGLFCLPNSYYPFMPLKINSHGTNLVYVNLLNTRSWCLSIDCIEKEFSIERFILAQCDWGKFVTAKQFSTIMETLDK